MNGRDEMEDLKKKKFKPHLSPKGITIEFSRQDLENTLPNLTKELNDPNNRSNLSFEQIQNAYNDSHLLPDSELNKKEPNKSIDDSEDNEELSKKKKKKIESRYDKESELYYPKTEDFLRRCSNQTEFEEIIEYQLKINLKS